MSTVRLVMNMDEELMKKIDSYAEKFHVNRTSAVSVLLSSAIEQAEFMSNFPQIIAMYQKEQELKEKDGEK